MIYEIVCNETGERYIGSTFEPTIARRISKHRAKTNTCCSKQIICRGNYSYGLLEKIDVETRDELRMCERKWYDKLQNINKFKPYRSFEEAYLSPEQKEEANKKYYQANKEEIKKQKREQYAVDKSYRQKYYKEHKEQILLKAKEAYANKLKVKHGLN